MIFGGLPFDLVSKIPVSIHHPLFTLSKVCNLLCLQLNVIGQLLGFIGSGLYAYYKLIGK